MKEFFKWILSHPVYSTLSVILAAIIMLNVMAYSHARAMLNYTQQGERTAPPESLSFFQKVKILPTGIAIPKPRNTATPATLDLPFEVHQFRLHDDISLEAWYIPHAQSNCVILLFHGYSAAKSTLLPEAKAFYESGYATFLMDFRGSGGSSGCTVSIGYYEADDVALAVEYVQELLPDHSLVLYGQSMGSAAILRFISTYNIQPDAIIIESVFDTMLSTVKNRFTAMGLPSFPGAHLLVFWGGLQSGFFGFSHNPAEYARMVRCPVLMLHGEKDTRVTIEQSKSVFDNLKGKKQFELFEGAGHESYYRYNPVKWTKIVSNFLKAHFNNDKR